MLCIIMHYDVIMPMYNFIESSKKYSRKFADLWNYYENIPADPITNSESFIYKTSVTGKQLIMKIQEKLNFLFH